MFGTQMQNYENRSYVQVKVMYSVLNVLTTFQHAFYMVLSVRIDNVVCARVKCVSGQECFQCCPRIQIRRSVTKRHN